MSTGMGGASRLRRRRGRGEHFDDVYAHTATSMEFGAIPRQLFDLRDAQIIPMRHRCQLTLAIEVTPDVQWTSGRLGEPAYGARALVADVRPNIKL